MRKLILALAVIGMTRMAGAVTGGGNPSVVLEVAYSSGSVIGITVSTSAPTRMDNPALSGRIALSIQNLDTVANLWCQFNNVSSTGTIHMISTRPAEWNLSIGDLDVAGNNFGVWCQSDGAAGTKAAVSQLNFTGR